MKIEFKEIKRHTFFPFMVREIILEIDGKEQPMCVGWKLSVPANDTYDVTVNRMYGVTKNVLGKFIILSLLAFVVLVGYYLLAVKTMSNLLN